MEVTALERREENIVLRGKMLGTMPICIYIKPEEVRAATKLLTWKVASYLPVFAVKAFMGGSVGNVGQKIKSPVGAFMKNLTKIFAGDEGEDVKAR